MRRFVADYQSLRNEYEKLCELKGTADGYVMAIEDSYETLFSVWDGNAAKVYEMSIKTDFLQIYAVMEKLQSAIDCLAFLINEYQKGEEMIRDRIGGLRI